MIKDMTSPCQNGDNALTTSSAVAECGKGVCATRGLIRRLAWGMLMQAATLGVTNSGGSVQLHFHRLNLSSVLPMFA